jgi:hypothetical protein
LTKKKDTIWRSEDQVKMWLLIGEENEYCMKKMKKKTE